MLGISHRFGDEIINSDVIIKSQLNNHSLFFPLKNILLSFENSLIFTITKIADDV